MKKILLTMLVFMFFGFSLSAQDASLASENSSSNVNPNAPVLTLDKLEYDYGTMYQNSDGNMYFVYTNDGQEPLIFSRVKSSCGCTIPKWSRQPLLPGQSDTMKVRYDTKRLGSFHKSITISSNASEPKVVLKIKGKVIAEPAMAMPTKNIDSEMSPVNK